MISDIISPYIITIVIAWTISHVVKFIINSLKNGKQSLKKSLFASGGMPSSHSATVLSLVTIIGLRDGFGSGLFGVAVLLALIVTYDAAKVRRSSGEQGIAIHQLIKSQDKKIELPRIAKGHTPLEVVVGAVLGVVIGAVVFFSTI